MDELRFIIGFRISVSIGVRPALKPIVSTHDSPISKLCATTPTGAYPNRFIRL